MSNKENCQPCGKTGGKGLKQIEALCAALDQSMIYDGQGSRAQPVDHGQVVKFLQQKLQDARMKLSGQLPSNGATPQSFKYLYDHCLGSTRDDVANAIQILNARHLPCLITNNHHQLKIASGLVSPTPSDKKNGKVRGLIQIQSHNLAMILDREELDFDTLRECLDALSSHNRGFEVGAHLCKQTCLQKGHCKRMGVTVNIKNHETCPGYWLVKGSLVNFCSCDEVQCIAPGPFFKANLFRISLLAFQKAIA